jgi:hypothetical protein
MSAHVRSHDQTLTAALLLTGGLLALVGNALHPHAPDSDPAATIAALATDATWPWIHLAIVGGILLIIGGLVLFARLLVGSLAEPLARLAVAALLIGGAVVTVSTSVDGFGMKALAVATQAAPATETAASLRAAIAVDTMDFGIWSMGMLILFGAGFGCFAFALAASRRLSLWYAALAGAGAILSGVAAVLQIAEGGETKEAETLFLVGSMLLTAWVLVLGVRLWRGLPFPVPTPAVTPATAGAQP